jgi:hypothetical protein
MHVMKTSAIQTIFICVAIISNAFHCFGQGIDPRLALKYFSEARSVSDKDNGRLWGLKLYGPLLIVDETTRQTCANEKVPVDGWVDAGGVFAGILPDNIGLANTSFRWEGKQWSMVLSRSIDTATAGRMALFMHELWHQHEDRLGFISSEDAPVHLNGKDGRVLICLEWNALLKACYCSGALRTQCISDALSFRKLRFGLYPNAGIAEPAKDLQEGMAEYTGMVLCGLDRPGKLGFLSRKLTSEDASTNAIVWTFAYVSGPLYGFLLDEKEKGWTRKLTKGCDLGEMLASAYHIGYRPAAKELLKFAGKPYGYDSINAKETARVEKANALALVYRKKFIEGKTLFLPNIHLQIQFDPGRIVPFDTIGSVYGILSGQAGWGSIHIDSAGVLLLKGWKGLLVAIPPGWQPGTPLSIPSGSIELKPGYFIQPSANGWSVAAKH